jgi:hypothetical protein
MSQSVIIRARVGDVGEWNGRTMADVRRFVRDNEDAPDDACIIAVTPSGTSELQGVGFFSMGGVR